MTEAIRAVIFDFNGVLVDDEPIHYRLFKRVLGEEGVELAEERYYDEYLGYDDRDCFKAALTAAGEPAEEGRVQRLIARKASYYGQLIREQGFPFFPGAADLVRSVAREGYPMAVVSGALRAEIEGALAQEGLTDLFRILVSAEDVEHGKPHPEGYRKALTALNSRPPLPERLLHPHEVLAVEDSPAGLSSAQEAGLRTLGVAQTYPASELSAAEAVVESVDGLDARGLARCLEG